MSAEEGGTCSVLPLSLPPDWRRSAFVPPSSLLEGNLKCFLTATANSATQGLNLRLYYMDFTDVREERSNDSNDSNGTAQTQVWTNMHDPSDGYAGVGLQEVWRILD